MWELEATVKVEGLVSSVHAYSRFRIFSDSFLKEVRFPLGGLSFPSIQMVACFIVSAASQGN
jgi:hypothetical protein